MDNKYRKKPVVIEAVQYTGTNLKEIEEFVGNNASFTIDDSADAFNPVADIVIHTLEGDMRVNEKDYIIKGVHGEYYPCKPDIFEKTYEKV